MKKTISVLACAALFFALFAGCARTTPVVRTTTIWSDIETTIGKTNMPTMGTVNDASLKEMYGIDATMLDEYTVRTAGTGDYADEYFVAKVKSGRMADVEAAIKNRQRDLDEKWRANTDIYPLISDSQVVKKGDYIFFVVSKDADRAIERFNAAFAA